MTSHVCMYVCIGLVYRAAKWRTEYFLNHPSVNQEHEHEAGPGHVSFDEFCGKKKHHKNNFKGSSLNILLEQI